MTSAEGPPLGSLELFQTMLSACERGDLPTVQSRTEEFSLNENNFLKCVDAEGDTILHKAIQKDTAVLHHCLKKMPFANPNQGNHFGKTPLHLAVKKNLPNALKLLIQYKADPHSFNNVGSNALHTAASCGSVECIEYLLNEIKMDVNAKDPLGNHVLHKCAYDGVVRVADYFLGRGAQLNQGNNQQQTPLHVATKANQLGLVKFLIEKKADVNATDSQGLTPMHYASSRCFQELAQLLTSQGADVNLSDQHGNTPLHAAARNFKPDSKQWSEFIYELIRMKANVEARNQLNKVPMDLVTRNYYKLFDVEEVTKEEQRRVKKSSEEASMIEALQIQRKNVLEEQKKLLEERERRAREEAERKRQDEEDQRQKEEEARFRLEEEEERRRLEEEEAKKKKKKKPKPEK